MAKANKDARKANKSSGAKSGAKSAAKAAKAPVKTDSKKVSARTEQKPLARDKKTTDKTKGAEPKGAATKVAPKPEAAVPKKSADQESSKAPGRTEEPKPAAAAPRQPEREPEKPQARAASASAGQPPAKVDTPEAKSSAAAAAAVPPAEPEEISELEGVRLPTTRGKVGVFGGPKDHSAKPDDKLALPTGRHSQYEPVRSLNARSFYCAMRWDYRQNHMSPEEGKRWWANKKIVVTDPGSGKSVITRAVDYGPHENTGLAISISPGALEALGIEVGSEVEMRFADQNQQTGPVEE